MNFMHDHGAGRKAMRGLACGVGCGKDAGFDKEKMRAPMPQ